MDDDRDDESHENIKKSGVWKHFEIANDRDRTATCNICFKLLSYRTSITNLKKHLARKHGDDEDMLSKISDDEGETIEELETYLEDAGEEDVPIDKRKILRNGAWEYFEIIDEEQRLAVCILCKEQFSYRTTSSNLAKHLKRRHYADIENTEFFNVTNNEDDDNDLSVNMSGGHRTSAAWDYFTIKDPVRRIATCKLCECVCSYLSSVSNLMKHVRRKHGVASEHDEEFVVADDSETEGIKNESNKRSPIWLYFKCIDKVAKISVCLICKRQLSHLTSITNLKKHLYRKHPGVKLKDMHDGKKMLIASDGQLYEIEDETKVETLEIDDDNNDDDDHQSEEPIELNAIYLDDYEGTVIEPNRKRKPSTSKRKRLIAENNDSSEGELTYQKQYTKKTSDSLDQFGKYLVSLLRQLPKELSNQLQADFVKQVMTSQLTYQSQNVVVAPSNGYSITITEAVPKGNNDAYISTEGNDVSQSQ
ncbi:uncharacterized protein LOC135085974 isoform X2 [Ostrinia nubilalis]|uniref:uncharacterized protein LOC135085974 isoform X2 n=1 Tax=Ostrinia nubilalis TaxID=29057 RepID=UPI0030825A60